MSWSTAVGSFLGLIAPGVWGSREIDAWGDQEIEADPMAGGLQAEGLFSIGDVFSLGAFLQVVETPLGTHDPGLPEYYQVMDSTQLAAGLAFRLGHGVSEMWWLGADVRLGGYYTWGEEDLSGGGTMIGASFVAAIVLFDSPGFKFGLESQIGLDASPWGDGGGTYSKYYDQWLVRPAFCLGVVLGA